MTSVKELFDPKVLRDRIDEGLVSERRHPTLPLSVLNYTPACQYSRAWDDVTLACRGLIIDDDMTVIGRGPRKFFNYEEHQDANIDLPLIPTDVPFIATQKVDGSLIVACRYHDEVVLATRGSFASDQAAWARTFWSRNQEVLPDIDDGESWCFEAIYPDNRIVIDYHGEDRLVLLCILDAIGMPQRQVFDAYQGDKVATTSFDSPEDALRDAKGLVDAEGYVLRFDNGLWVKTKSSWYVDLHRIVTGLNERSVWESLVEGTFDEMVVALPDEIQPWANEVAESLRNEFALIENTALSAYEHVRSLPSRKDQAIALRGNPHAGLVFSMLDGKRYDAAIWKTLRPKGSSDDG